MPLIFGKDRWEVNKLSQSINQSINSGIVVCINQSIEGWLCVSVNQLFCNQSINQTAAGIGHLCFEFFFIMPRAAITSHLLVIHNHDATTNGGICNFSFGIAVLRTSDFAFAFFCPGLCEVNTTSERQIMVYPGVKCGTLQIKVSLTARTPTDSLP